MSRTKVLSDVCSSRSDPASPPDERGDGERQELALHVAELAPVGEALARLPGQRAMVLVALAGTGATPAKSSAGKATKLPPPATELMRAADAAAATKSRTPMPRASLADGVSVGA